MVALEANLSQTKFAVPFDSTGGASQNDHQRDVNSFLNLGWHHQFATPANGAHQSELFTGLFARHGSLNYSPSRTTIRSSCSFRTRSIFNLSEQRSFNTYGIKADYAMHPSNEVEFKVGTLSSVTSGHENFVDRSPRRALPGPASNSGSVRSRHRRVRADGVLSGRMAVEIRAGVRYDAHNAPFVGHAVAGEPAHSPQLLSVDVDDALWVLRAPVHADERRGSARDHERGAGRRRCATPTLPERDNFFEAGLIQRIPNLGMIAKLSAYHKESAPGIDDNTVPGSAIVTVGKHRARQDHRSREGARASAERPVLGYVNAALNHAYGTGTITGGFFPDATAATASSTWTTTNGCRSSAARRIRRVVSSSAARRSTARD